MKNFAIQKFFNPEAPKAQIDANLALAYKRYPELKNLNLTPREVLARENALSKLDEYITNPRLMVKGSEWGFSNWMRDVFTFEKTQETLLTHIKHVRGLLLKPYNPTDWSKQQRIAIQKVNPDKSIDFPQTYDTNMTYKMFLAKFVDNVSVILRSPTPKPNNVNGKTPETLANQRKIDQAEIENNARLGNFILAVQQIDKGKNHKIYINAMDALERGEYTKARNLIGDHVKKEFNLNINLISTKEGYADAMRSLGLTQDAQKNYQESLTEKSAAIMSESDESKEKQVLMRYQDFVEKYQGNQYEINKKTNQTYDMYVASLAHGSVEYQNVTAKEAEIKQNIATAMLVSSATENFIEKNPDAKLLPELAKIGDMNGIGWLDFSDKTVKITKEVAIVLVSFVVTAGIGSFLTMVGGAARAAVVARSAQTMGKTWKIITAGINVAGRTATAGATAVNTIKRAGLVGEALMFTTAESMLHSIFRSEWERSGFSHFLEKFAKNTAMFGAFAGMEKFVTGPITAKFLKEWVAPSMKVTLAQSAVLTAGDVAAMSTLHAIETGQSGLDGWESILVALAFRIGFKGVQNHFPNALNRFRSKPKAEQQQIIDDVAKIEWKTPDFTKQIFTYVDDSAKKWGFPDMKNQTFTYIDDATKINSPASRVKIVDNSIDLVAEKAQSINILNNPKAGSIIEWISGKNFIYNAGTKKWHVFDDKVETVLTAKFPKNWSMTTAEMRQAIMKEFRFSPNSHHFETQYSSQLFRGKENTFKAWDEMVKAPEWSRVELKIFDETVGEWWNATYIKNGKQWTHESSNISATTMADDALKLLRTGKNETYLSREAKWKLSVEEVNLMKPERVLVKWEPISVPGKPTPASWKPEIIWVTPATPLRPISHLPIKAENVKGALGNVPFSMRNIDDAINKTSTNATDDLRAAIISKNPEKLDTFFKSHWPSIVGGTTALKLLPFWLEQNKINPHANIPDVMPTSVEEAKVICLECMQDVVLPTIDYARPSEVNAKVILDEKRREAITARGIKTAEWQSAVALWEELNQKYSEYFSEAFKEKVNIALTVPTVTNIQQLQNCIGMESVDKAVGQDGIVGPRTTKAFHEFLQKSQEECVQIYGDTEVNSTEEDFSSESMATLNDSEWVDQSDVVLTETTTSDINISSVEQNAIEAEVPYLDERWFYDVSPTEWSEESNPETQKNDSNSSNDLPGYISHEAAWT